MKKITLCLILGLLLVSQAGHCIALKEKWSKIEQVSGWAMSESGNYMAILGPTKYEIFRKDGQSVLSGKNIWGASQIFVTEHYFGVLDKNEFWRLLKHDGTSLWNVKKGDWPAFSSSEKYIILFDDEENVKICSLDGEVLLSYVSCEGIFGFLENDTYLVKEDGIYEFANGAIQKKIIDNPIGSEIRQVGFLKSTKQFVISSFNMTQGMFYLKKYNIDGNLLSCSQYSYEVLLDFYEDYYILITEEQKSIELYENDIQINKYSIDSGKILNSFGVYDGYLIVYIYNDNNKCVSWIDKDGEVINKIDIKDDLCWINPNGSEILIYSNYYRYREQNKVLTYMFYSIEY